MKLRLLTGLAGTGKSTCCYEEICRALKDTMDVLFLVVPSHLIHDAEEEILARVGGYDRLKVLTIPQLAGWILRQSRIDSRSIGPIERQLLLQTALYNSRSKLKVLRDAAGRYRFTQTVGHTIAFIQQNGVSLAQFADRIEQKGAANSKLCDLALLARMYAERLGNKDDQESLLFRAIALLNDVGSSADYHAGTLGWDRVKVWIDGYLWLSPLEQEFIVKLARCADQVTVTSLCLPSDSSKESNVDGQNARPQSSDAKRRSFLSGIKEAAGRLGIPTQEQMLGEHAHLPPSLAQVAARLFTSNAVPMSGADTVTITQYPDEEKELLGTCARIMRLVRSGRARWRDVMVVVGDMGSYRKMLIHIFGQHGIPHDLCTFDTAGAHPLVRLMFQLADAVDSRLASEKVIDLIKSPLWPGTDEEKDLLEEYALKHGIEGDMWIKESSWAQPEVVFPHSDEVHCSPSVEEDLHITELRKRILAPLKSFWESVSKAENSADFLQALWAVVSDLHLDGQTEFTRQVTSAATFGGRTSEGCYMDIVTARLNESVWKQLIEVFDRLYEQLGQEYIDWEHFAAVWKSCLSEIRISEQPERLDAVRIVSVEQAVGVSVPYVFVIGCVDGVFGRAADPSILVTPRELRQVAGPCCQVFPALAEQQANGEDQLSYIAFTRSTRQMWVSWPRLLQGRQAYPHEAVNALRRLFSDVVVQEESVLPVELWVDYQLAAASIAEWVDKRADSISDEVLDVYNWLCSDAKGRTALGKYLNCAMHPGASSNLRPDVAHRLYGDPFVTSVSELEAFAKCPFSHFLKYGLRLKPMRKYTIEFTDYGILVHAGLREFFRCKQRREGEVDRKLLEKWVDEFLDRGITQTKQGIFAATSRHRHFAQRIRARLLDALEILLAEEKRSHFHQVDAEVEFSRNSKIGSLELALGNGDSAWLCGQIDRIDVCEHDDKKWVRVWDYKLGGKGLDLVLVREGISLQLLAYLLVLVENGWENCPVFPAAVQYFSVPDVFLKSACGPLADEVREKAREKGYQVSGLFTDNREILRLIDEEMGSRALYPIRFKKGTDEFYTDCQERVASQAEWEEIFAYLRCKMAELARHILDGCTLIFPYRYGNECTCDLCDYNEVCFFDLAAPNYRYRIIPKLGRKATGKAKLLMSARAVGGETCV